MRTLRSTWLAVLVVLFAVAAIAPADEGGWRFPNLNPFQSSKPAKPRAAASVSDNNSESMFQFPKLPSLPRPSLPFAQKPKPQAPRVAAPRRPAPQGPSTFERVSTGTKSFFSKTYDVLTPWDNDAPAKPATQPRSARRADASSNSSWFPWFSSKSEPERVETVNEFIALPRVKP